MVREPSGPEAAEEYSERNNLHPSALIRFQLQAAVSTRVRKTLARSVAFGTLGKFSEMAHKAVVCGSFSFLPKFRRLAGNCVMGATGATEQADCAAVLVVEDDSLVRETIVEHLKDRGYCVLEAASAEEAQAVLQGGFRVAVVFSDVVMPGKNGFELASWIHNHYPEVQILLTSGYDSAARRATNMPCEDRFLAKPYLLDQVLQGIETMLAQY
jgi:CheY-like chemotaxis protein